MVVPVILGAASFALAAPALAAPGDLDTSFSGDGLQQTDFGDSFDEFAHGVVIQPDGKIVSVGAAGPFFASGEFALARHNPDGTPDTSFSGDGKQTTDVDGGEARGVALQADGKLVVAGPSGGGADFGVVRYNEDGTLDTSFSGDGKQTTDFSGESDSASAISIQPNGKIVVAGSATNISDESEFAVARYNADGTLDTSFSGDGKQTTNFGGFSGATSLVIQADGKMIAAGSAVGDFALARYNDDGTLDASFSGDGKQTTDFGVADNVTDLALQVDGKIVAVGHTGQCCNGDAALARYDADGSLDASFSGDGKQTTDFGAWDSAQGVAIQPDGKIVVTGGLNPGCCHDLVVARYNAAGVLDPTFAADGIQTNNFGGADFGGDIAIQPDGKLVVAGRCCADAQDDPDFALVRYHATGSAPPQRTLTVSTTGTGQGTVTGPGINCPGDCSETYADGTDVALSATAAGGSDFAGFSGACAGSSCSLTMDADEAVTATFSAVASPADSDGDGLADASDSCPTEAGSVSNGGCPVSTPPGDDGDDPPSGGGTVPPPSGSTPPPSGPTEEQIESVLADQVKTAANDLKQLGLDKLLKTDVFKAQVTALTAGTFKAKLKGADPAKRAVTIAKGSDSFPGIDKGKVKMKLTKSGEKLLEKAKKARAAVKGSLQLAFSGEAGGSAKAAESVKLK